MSVISSLAHIDAVRTSEGELLTCGHVLPLVCVFPAGSRDYRAVFVSLRVQTSSRSDKVHNRRNGEQKKWTE